MRIILLSILVCINLYCFGQCSNFNNSIFVPAAGTINNCNSVNPSGPATICADFNITFSNGNASFYWGYTITNNGTPITTTFGPINSSQTASFPDIAINTKREKLKDFKKTTFFSSKKQMQSGWEITIRNNKPNAVEVTMNDQVPLSSDSQMEVEVEELSGGKLNKETGIVEWKLSLKPGEQIKKRIIYSVRIPKDKKVSL